MLESFLFDQLIMLAVLTAVMTKKVVTMERLHILRVVILTAILSAAVACLFYLAYPPLSDVNCVDSKGEYNVYACTEMCIMEMGDSAPLHGLAFFVRSFFNVADLELSFISCWVLLESPIASAAK